MAVDGGWGWIVVVGSAVCHFFLLGISRCIGLVFALLQERFEASATDAALAAAIFVSVRALGGPIGSKLSDKFGCRAVTMTGSVLLCVGPVLCSLATKLIFVYLALGIIAGMGGVMVFSPSYVAVSQWFDKKKGKAMALSTLGSGLGSICMAPLIALLIDQYDYFGTMLIIGSLLLNNAVGGALYRTPPTSQPERDTHADAEQPSNETALPGKEEDCSPVNTSVTAEAGDDTAVMRTTEDPTNSEFNSCHDPLPHSQMTQNTAANDSQKTDTRRDKESSSCNADCGRKCLRHLRSPLWTNIPFVVYCMVVVTVQGCIQSVLVFLPSRCRELGAGQNAAALLLTLFGVFDMTGRFVFGFVFDLRAVRSRRSYAYTAVTASFGALAALISAASNYKVLAVATCVVAVFEGGAHSQRATCVTEIVGPSQMSLSVGLVIFAQGFGNFYGPLVGGALRDRTGSYVSGFVFGGMTLFTASVLMMIILLLRHRRRRNLTTPQHEGL